MAYPDPRYGVAITDADPDSIGPAALETVGNLSETAKIHGIGITFEPNEQGRTAEYIRGMGGGNLASAYDLFGHCIRNVHTSSLDQMARFAVVSSPPSAYLMSPDTARRP